MAASVSDATETSVQPAAALARLSLSWYLRLMAAAVDAYYVDDCTCSQFLPHLDELQRRYYQHFAPLLRAAGKPCPDVVAYALLALSEGRYAFPTRVASSPAGPAQWGTGGSTTAKAALQQCLAEYEQLPHLHSQPRFHSLFF